MLFLCKCILTVCIVITSCTLFLLRQKAIVSLRFSPSFRCLCHAVLFDRQIKKYASSIAVITRIADRVLLFKASYIF